MSVDAGAFAPGGLLMGLARQRQASSVGSLYRIAAVSSPAPRPASGVRLPRAPVDTLKVYYLSAEGWFHHGVRHGGRTHALKTSFVIWIKNQIN
jgi:hypothetical protein